jgi:hypothetical protein
MLSVAFVYRVRHVQEYPLGEAEPMRQGRDESDHQHAAHHRADQALHVRPRPLHVQHEPDHGHEKDHEAQLVSQPNDRIA